MADFGGDVEPDDVSKPGDNDCDSAPETALDYFTFYSSFSSFIFHLEILTEVMGLSQYRRHGVIVIVVVVVTVTFPGVNGMVTVSVWPQASFDNGELPAALKARTR